MDINLYEGTGKHVAFPMTPGLPDLDNSQTFFYVSDYMKHSLRRIWKGIAQTKPESPEKNSQKELALWQLFANYYKMDR